LPHGINGNSAQAHEEENNGKHEMPDSYREAKEIFERQFLREKLIKHNWNVSRTAEEIGVERSNLHRKIKSYNIEPD
jgi:two-component system nitrogen regulation response regulator NtrX